MLAELVIRMLIVPPLAFAFF